MLKEKRYGIGKGGRRPKGQKLSDLSGYKSGLLFQFPQDALSRIFASGQLSCRNLTGEFSHGVAKLLHKKDLAGSCEGQNTHRAWVYEIFSVSGPAVRQTYLVRPETHCFPLVFMRCFLKAFPILSGQFHSDIISKVFH